MGTKSSPCPNTHESAIWDAFTPLFCANSSIFATRSRFSGSFHPENVGKCVANRQGLDRSACESARSEIRVPAENMVQSQCPVRESWGVFRLPHGRESTRNIHFAEQ